MTCIAAIEDSGKVFMGGDSVGSDGRIIQVRADPKVFLVGDFLVGFTSSFRMGQVLRYSFKPPARLADVDDLTYMNTAFVDAIRAKFKEAGFATKQSDQDLGGEFLVGYKGRIYHFGSDFQVGLPALGYDAVGCGDMVAMASMFSTPGLPPAARIETALKAAEQFTPYVRPPFTLLEK